MAACEKTKAAGATLDYGFLWIDWLEPDETVESSTWSVSEGVTLSNAQITEDGKTTSVMVSGGSDGQRYKLTNTITTSSGRIEQRCISLLIGCKC